MKRLISYNIIAVLFIFFCFNCKSNLREAKNGLVTGKELSKIYCVSCHAYPEPELLDKTTWNQFVLVRMASFMGIYTDNIRYYDKMPEHWIEPGEGGQRVKAANIYPEKALLTIEDWEKIKAFYLQNAPEKLDSNSDKLEIKLGIPFMNSSSFDIQKNIAPLIQSLYYDSLSKSIIVAQYQKDLFQYDTKGKELSRVKINGHFVDIQRFGEDLYILDMGSRLASDNPKGKLLRTKKLEGFSQKDSYDILLSQLMRPVDFNVADFNADGKADFVIAEYGSNLGALNLYLSGERGFTKKTLLEEDGAIRTEIKDVNKDGFLDIVALMANADEGIDQYINDGQGSFVKSRIVRFSATNGSTHFELIDWDEEGSNDLLYSNGDNGDYTPINKPYHGIHLFANNKNKYEEKFFIPMHGVYQSQAVDLDLDGDRDIVAVSFHPDFKGDSKEGFQVFINKGNDTFEAFTIKEYDASRWMRFIISDIDEDGDPDILLSAMNIKTPDVPSKNVDNWKMADKALIIIENQTINN